MKTAKTINDIKDKNFIVVVPKTNTLVKTKAILKKLEGLGFKQNSLNESTLACMESYDKGRTITIEFQKHYNTVILYTINVDRNESIQYSYNSVMKLKL